MDARAKREKEKRFKSRKRQRKREEAQNKTATPNKRARLEGQAAEGKKPKSPDFLLRAFHLGAKQWTSAGGKLQVKLFSMKEPPVVEVRVDNKAKAERERAVAKLAAIDSFDFVTEGSKLLVHFTVSRDALSFEHASGPTYEWHELPLGKEVIGKGNKSKETKEIADDDGSEEQKIKIELQIEGDDAKRTKVKEAFLVALSKAKEAAVKEADLGGQDSEEDNDEESDDEDDEDDDAGEMEEAYLEALKNKALKRNIDNDSMGKEGQDRGGRGGFSRGWTGGGRGGGRGRGRGRGGGRGDGRDRGGVRGGRGDSSGWRGGRGGTRGSSQNRGSRGGMRGSRGSNKG